MSEQVKTKDRIPFEDLDQESEVASWSLPPMNGSSNVVRRKKTSSAKENVSIEPVTGGSAQGPMTAEVLQQITEDARREGFQQGLKEGTEQGIREGTKAGEKAGSQRAYMEAKKEVDQLQHTLRSLVQRLYDPVLNQDEQLENILTDLVLNISKKLISQEVSESPQIILDIVKKVLSDLPKGSKNIHVFMNQEDADRVEALVPEAHRVWSIERDESIDSGGCKVKTDYSLVDYSISTRVLKYFSDLKASEQASIEKNGNTIEEKIDVPNYHETQPDIIHDRESDQIEERHNRDKENISVVDSESDKNVLDERDADK